MLFYLTCYNSVGTLLELVGLQFNFSCQNTDLLKFYFFSTFAMLATN